MPVSKSFRAAYLSWLITGGWGCEDAAVREQREPWRGPIVGAAGDGAGGALFLAMISARGDGDTGRFLRDLWGLASQKSWHRVAMHGTPDLWEALDRSARVAGDPLKGIIEEISVARFFTGTEERRRAATFPQVRLMPEDAVIPLALDGLRADLQLDGRPVRIHYRVAARGAGPRAVALNGQVLPATRLPNPYRTGGLAVPMDALRRQLRPGANELVVELE